MSAPPDGRLPSAPPQVYYQAQRQDPRVDGLVVMESGSLDAAPAPDPLQKCIVRNVAIRASRILVLQLQVELLPELVDTHRSRYS